MKQIAVFVSGGGTNLQALIDAQGSVLKSGKIALVVANNAGAYALERAKNAGIATAVVYDRTVAQKENTVHTITGYAGDYLLRSVKKGDNQP